MLAAECPLGKVVVGTGGRRGPGGCDARLAGADGGAGGIGGAGGGAAPSGLFIGISMLSIVSSPSNSEITGMYDRSRSSGKICESIFFLSWSCSSASEKV